jgi:UDP-N-acetyl-D-mannosaminuronic acid dehydrogenase
MGETSFKHDVSVVGLGRVGLPLALSFADHDLDVIGVDKDPARIATVESGTMPFQEEGTQELLDRVRASGRLRLSERIEEAAEARYIVLTLGTPSLWHIEIDIADIRSVLDSLLPVLREGHALVLRSTVAPGTTEFVAGYLEQQRGFQIGKEVFVAHAPERIAENHFLEEITTLPTSSAESTRIREPGRAPLRGVWPRIVRRRRCRRSSRRSGPTSSATRTSRFRTC